MSWFFNQWVYGSDIPEYTWAYQSKETPEGFDVRLKIKQENVPDNFKMLIPIQVNFGQDRFYRTKILVDKKLNEIALPFLPLEPESIEFNIYEAVLAEHDEEDWDDL